MVRLSSYRDFDWVLLGFVLLLSLISVLEIKSATLHTKFHGFDHKQIGFLAVGLVLMFLISLIDYHRLIDISHWAYGISILSLVAVLAVGTKVLGGKRWINLGHGFHFQPSEWVKLILIISVARFFWGLVGKELTWTGHRQGLRAGMYSDGPGAEATGPWNCSYLSAYPHLWIVSWRNSLPPSRAYFAWDCANWRYRCKERQTLKPYQQARIDAFINPDSDPRGSGYQIRQSLIAVGAGGIWGKGANKGTQTQGDFLPIPYTDFIFAAFCEEHGFVGAVGVLLLYFLILMRLIQNAQTASDLPGSFIIMGVVAVIVFQVAVNVGMVVGLMPVTGIPLPLLSYGGSSVLFTFMALGIVMNIRMRRFVN